MKTLESKESKELWSQDIEQLVRKETQKVEPMVVGYFVQRTDFIWGIFLITAEIAEGLRKPGIECLWSLEDKT